MGKGGNNNSNLNLSSFTWDEIKKHTTQYDKWIVINGHVYDITTWQKRHPGGARIISHFSGQDATEVWTAMHDDKEQVSKYLKPLLVGLVEQDTENKKTVAMQKDMEELRTKAHEMGLFKANPWFYVAQLVHIHILEVLALLAFYYFGTGWGPYLIVAVILATSQAQAGWSQHDYGHLSVLPNSWLNHLAHEYVIGHLKGASSHWWNFRHNQHHAKPNVHQKDPDITVPYVFLLGNKVPVIWAKKKRGVLPYNQQHNYFWILGPPILLPLYFHIENIYFIIKRRGWWDFVWMLSFFIRLFYCYTHFLTAWQVFWLYMLARFIESFWFVFVTQMNHLVMDIDFDQNRDWLSSQTIATCNVDSSFFNDWFTGHLNFQIEHHLFPTMPRHNYYKIAPYARELCQKHNLSYISKPLGVAMADILRSLKKSGKIWFHAYYSD